MDDLPNIHWRTERNVGLKPMSPRMAIVDVFVLTACCAAGMALARWVMPYEYNAGIQQDAEWVLVFAVAPAFFGLINLGQVGLLALHSFQRRRPTRLSRCEIAGLTTTSAIVLMFAMGSSAANSRAGGALLMLVSLLTMLSSAGVTLGVLVRRFTKGERLSWTELHGAVASLVPGVWFAYGVASSFPFC